jgi:eukaryotic-like serine/threonine-protein kinase
MSDPGKPNRSNPPGGSVPLKNPAETEPENLNLGTVAVSLGFCTSDQVETCIRLQQEMRSLGFVPKKIGEILLEKGYLKGDQLEETLKQQVQRSVHVQITGYRFVNKIGQGAMGAIYKAVQLSMDRAVAVKILSPKYARNARFVERFFREARAVAKLNHPNIIQGIDVGEVDGLHYFVMEYVDGRTVGDLIRRGGSIDEKRCLYIVLQTAKALSHAWKNGLLHRDLKPDNIMIARDGVAKLCDLGLAKNLMIGLDATVTNPGAAVGTPHYIAPEQARAEPTIDLRADIYGLGATFYHMAVGDVPFPADSASIVLTKALTETPPSPRSRNPLISSQVDAVIMKMMAKEREKRYQDADELTAALEAVPRDPGVVIAPAKGASVVFPTRRHATASIRRFRRRHR